MSIMDVKLIKKELIKQLDEKRYEHTIGVADTAAALAMKYGINLKSAYYAGLLHDCAKCYNEKKRTRLCKKYNFEITPAFEASPSLIHAPLGAILAKEKYGVTSEEILNAIRWHTTGKPAMTTLEMIIFAADYIEPNRKMIPGLPEIREIIFDDLETAVYYILRDTLSHLASKLQVVDSTTEEAFAYYKKIYLEKNK